MSHQDPTSLLQRLRRLAAEGLLDPAISAREQSLLLQRTSKHDPSIAPQQQAPMPEGEMDQRPPSGAGGLDAGISGADVFQTGAVSSSQPAQPDDEGGREEGTAPVVGGDFFLTGAVSPLASSGPQTPTLTQKLAPTMVLAETKALPSQAAHEASAESPMAESLVAPRLWPGQVLCERYQLLALLGEGGMGQVYLAEDQHKGRLVALKCLRPALQTPSMERRLRRELRLNEKLNHPGLVKTFDLAQDDDAALLFFTMEYIQEPSLQWWMQQRPINAAIQQQRPYAMTREEREEIVQVMDALCQTVAALHLQGLIHRDLKPHNFLGTPHTRIKLLDLGIAQWTLAGEGQSMLWTQHHAGTAYYMAPEQLQGGDLTHAVDIYALGVIAFQLCCGRLPQPGMPQPSAMIEGLPQAVDAVIAQALHWQPRQRYVSAADFGRALYHAMSGRGMTVPLSQLTIAASAAQNTAHTGPQLRVVEQTQSSGTTLSTDAPRPRPPASSPSKKQRSQRRGWAALQTSWDEVIGTDGVIPETLAKICAEALALGLSRRGLRQKLQQELRRRGQAPYTEALPFPEQLSSFSPQHTIPVDKNHAQTADNKDDAAAARELNEKSASLPEVSSPASALSSHALPDHSERVPADARSQSVPWTDKRPAWLERRFPATTPQWLSLTPGELPPQTSTSGLAAIPPLPPRPLNVRGQVLRSKAGQPLLEFVAIEAGTFWMGAAPDDSEASAHEELGGEVALPCFWCARNPVTNGVWWTFLEESGAGPEAYAGMRHWLGRKPSPELWHQPVIWVSWSQAWAFCEFYGLCLPSEAEWEKAVRGTDARLFPWGAAAPNATKANFGRHHGRLRDVGQTPAGNAASGLVDGAGQVMEWCADGWSARALQDKEAGQPPWTVAQAKRRVVVRGGHYDSAVRHLRCSHRQGMAHRQGHAHVGFRPVWSTK